MIIDKFDSFIDDMIFQNFLNLCNEFGEIPWKQFVFIIIDIYRPWQIPHERTPRIQNYELYELPCVIFFKYVNSGTHLFSFLSTWTNLKKLRLHIYRFFHKEVYYHFLIVFWTYRHFFTYSFIWATLYVKHFTRNGLFEVSQRRYISREFIIQIAVSFKRWLVI